MIALFVTGPDLVRFQIYTHVRIINLDTSVPLVSPHKWFNPRHNAGGIPEEIVGKLFDAFFTTKGPDNGTGIGLFMSKTIIEKSMGGYLTVRNCGDGAEFEIEV